VPAESKILRALVPSAGERRARFERIVGHSEVDTLVRVKSSTYELPVTQALFLFVGPNGGRCTL
jgi:hypothetical protein